jgi:hypothetical protein
MNFVALCIANVAPSSSGRCSSGDANVESTATGTPAAHSTSSSATSSSGFDGDSSHSRSALSDRASVAAVSVVSTVSSAISPAAARDSSSVRVHA